MSDERKWIEPELDGGGGGFGKFKGITIRELSQSYASIASEPNMRSVTAILRITREQLESRSQLGVSTQAAVVMGVITAGLGIGDVFMPENLRPKMIKGVVCSAVIFIGFLSGALSNRKMAKAAVAQDRAIREIALDALGQIVSSPDFRAKPLDSVQKQTLKQLLRRNPDSQPRLRELLDL